MVHIAYILIVARESLATSVIDKEVIHFCIYYLFYFVDFVFIIMLLILYTRC